MSERRYFEPWPWSWFLRREARRAIERYHGVPYLRELTQREHHGMLLLEDRGEVERAFGLDMGDIHWHRRHPRLHRVPGRFRIR